ncbi:MAG: zf-TFIIB domain-containing protein [Cyanobacteria bacterium J06641_5]
MKPTRCPKCRGDLQAVVFADVEVDRCQKCAGIWFDSHEAERLRAIEGSEHLDTGRPAVGNVLDRVQGKLRCPRCNTVMKRMVDIDEHSIWYERCPACQGIWLDAGEFKKFKDNFQSKGFVRRVRKAFRK